MKYLLIVLCILFDILYIICCAKNKNILGLIVKTLAASCFIAIGYMAYVNHKSNFYQIIMMGLLMDTLGDIFLALRNIFAKTPNFLIGSLCFLCGHILYVRGLFLLGNDFLLECIIASIVLGSSLFFVYTKVCRIPKAIQVVGITYMIMIIMMMTMSIGVYFTYRSASNLVFMLGAILFVSSDMLLILYNFSKKESWMHPVYSLLYFTAQILISFSLHL